MKYQITFTNPLSLSMPLFFAFNAFTEQSVGTTVWTVSLILKMENINNLCKNKTL